MKRQITFDSHCYDLAEHFLVDKPLHTPDRVRQLAAHIQVSIEEWMAMAEGELDQ